MPGPGGLINPNAPQQQGEVFTLPYPAAAGTLGPTVDFSNKMNVGQQGVQAVGKRVSGAWLEITNNSDSVLRVQFDTSALSVPVLPGTFWSGPIPLTSTKLLTTIIQQNAVQFYTLQSLYVVFYAAEDLAVGYRPREGPFSPNVPAAAIGPGTLPAGVLLPANQVTTPFPLTFIQPSNAVDASVWKDANGVIEGTIGAEGTGGAFAQGLYLFDSLGNAFIVQGGKVVPAHIAAGVLTMTAPITLAAGNQETGYLAVTGSITNTGQAQGLGVNFKTHLTNIPSSITLANITQNNIASTSVSNITRDGFQFTILGTALGGFNWVGTYTTVGN